MTPHSKLTEMPLTQAALLKLQLLAVAIKKLDPDFSNVSMRTKKNTKTSKISDGCKSASQKLKGDHEAHKAEKEAKKVNKT
jgi:hypothetical protein